MQEQLLGSLFSKNKFGDSVDRFFKRSAQARIKLSLTGRANHGWRKMPDLRVTAYGCPWSYAVSAENCLLKK